MVGLSCRNDVLTSVLPVYEALLKTNLRMLVFSGDVDAIVPVVGSRRWVTSLGLPTVVTWRPWVSSTGASHLPAVSQPLPE